MSASTSSYNVNCGMEVQLSVILSAAILPIRERGMSSKAMFDAGEESFAAGVIRAVALLATGPDAEMSRPITAPSGPVPTTLAKSIRSDSAAFSRERRSQDESIISLRGDGLIGGREIALRRDISNDSADRNRHLFGDADLCEHAIGLSLDVDRCLVILDVEEHLTFLYDFALALFPLHDEAFRHGEAQLEALKQRLPWLIPPCRGLFLPRALCRP